MAEIDYFDRELGACGDAISWPFDVEKVRALRERNEYLEHRLFPGQGENYENEVERLRYVLDEYRRILDERQEAYAELYGTEQWLRYEWGKRGEALDRVNALLDARAEEHAEFLRKVETGEIIMMDRAIGPVQVYVRDVRAAIGDTT